MVRVPSGAAGADAAGGPEMTVIIAVVVLGLLIFIHELGHFAFARRAGMAVLELAFGMGPRILSTNRGETVYSLRALPFGGFVRVASSTGSLPEDPQVAPERLYESRPLGGRLMFTAAGPAMNLLLAVVLLASVFGLIGVEEAVLDSTELGTVLEGAPAADAGLRAGDRIVAIDGHHVAGWTEMVALVQDALGESIEVTFDREGELHSVVVRPAPHPQDPRVGFLGVAATVRRYRMPLGTAIGRAFAETGRMLAVWVQGIAALFAGGGVPDVTGPVGIVQMLGEATRFGLANFFYLAALISANFGMINLFPIPALDGSRLVFLVLEGIRGKPLPPEQEGRVHMIGFVLLMGLLFLLTYKDLLRLIGGGGP